MSAIKPSTNTDKIDNLETCIRHRHSVRSFLPTPVPADVLYECLALAQLAPSNSNIQNWRLYIAQGAAAERVRAALMAEATTHGPNIAPLPEPFRHFRSALGLEIYGKGLRIPREDTEARKTAVLRNYEFFGAPLVAAVCMEKCLGLVDAMSVGMYLQTLMLLLTERGLGTCCEASVAGYPEVLKRELGIGEDMMVLCGLAVGYADENNEVNRLTVVREAVGKNVVLSVE